MYGFWDAKSSYHSEVHISDLCLSFYCNAFSAVGFVIVHMIPSDMENRYSWMSIVPSTGSAIVLIACTIINQDVEIFCKYCNSIVAVCFFISYIPQYVLIYRNKTTFGWSMGAVWLEFFASTFGIVQLAIDHYDLNTETGFWADLNYGKFFLNLVGATSGLVFFVQHYVIYRANNRLMAQGKPIDGLAFKFNIDEDCFDAQTVVDLTLNAKAEIMSQIPNKMTLGDQSDHKPLFGIKMNRRDSFVILNHINQHQKSIQAVVDI